MPSTSQPAFFQSIDSAQAAAAGGDEIFDYHHFGSGFYLTFDLIGQSV